jgi:hypothetical protein
VCSWRRLFKSTCVQLHDYIRMFPSKKADVLACVRANHHTWKGAWGECHICFHVSELLQVYLYSGVGAFKRVFLLASFHVRARPSEHASLQVCMFLLVLLLKCVFLETSMQVYVCSTWRFNAHASEYESRRAILREECLRRVSYKFSCVAVVESLLVFRCVSFLLAQRFECLKACFS